MSAITSHAKKLYKNDFTIKTFINKKPPLGGTGSIPNGGLISALLLYSFKRRCLIASSKPVVHYLGITCNVPTKFFISAE